METHPPLFYRVVGSVVEMSMQFSDLRNKELICIQDGMKIGFVDDLEFDEENQRITAFISYGKQRLFGLLGKYDDVKISCNQIQVIGEDIILVNDYSCNGTMKPKKDSFWNRLFE